MTDWKLLGIKPTDDVDAVKKAFAKKLKECRPEDDAELYQRTRNAYENIVKNLKRKKSNPQKSLKKIISLATESKAKEKTAVYTERENETKGNAPVYADEEFKRAQEELDSAEKGNGRTSRARVNEEDFKNAQKDLKPSRKDTGRNPLPKAGDIDLEDAQKNPDSEPGFSENEFENARKEIDSTQSRNGSRTRRRVNRTDLEKARKNIDSEKGSAEKGRVPKINMDELKKIQAEMETENTSTIDDMLPSMEQYEFPKDVLHYSVSPRSTFTFNRHEPVPPEI